MGDSYDTEFLNQIYASHNKLEQALEEILKNIFNLYDSNGDGKLDVDDYLGFISDLMYISTLMNRVADADYTLEAVVRFAVWSSSNFPSSLFREPQVEITYEIFLDGIMHALTEHKHLPIYGERYFYTSLMPEVINYFNYYGQIAKRRGWPTYAQHPTVSVPIEPSNQVVGEPSVLVLGPVPIEPSTPVVVVVEHVDLFQGDGGTTVPLQLQDYQQRQREQYEIRQQQRRIEQQRQHEREEQIRHQNELREHLIRLQQDRENELREQHDNPDLSVPPPQAAYNDQLIQFEDGEQPQQFTPLEDAGVIDVDVNEEGYDPIEGEISVLQFIKDNHYDNIAFKVGHGYYLARKSRIKMMIHIGEKDNSIFYGCSCEIDADWTDPFAWSLLPHAVIENVKYYNIQQLGLPVRYVKLDHILALLDSTDNYFIIEKPEIEVVIPSFASDNVLNHGIGSMSGLHCQTGQSDTVYEIKRFSVRE